jgi:hypothetical protein
VNRGEIKHSAGLSEAIPLPVCWATTREILKERPSPVAWRPVTQTERRAAVDKTARVYVGEFIAGSPIEFQSV